MLFYLLWTKTIAVHAQVHKVQSVTEDPLKGEVRAAQAAMAPAVSARPCIGRYEVGRMLGEGQFAKVKFGRHIETGAPVAIKIIEKDRLCKADKLVTQEISIMKLIKHPHVVRILEVMASKRNIYIVLEYVSGGELLDKILEHGKLKEDEARRYFRQLICGVEYCHSRGVYHRDLKPENLLLDENDNLKIIDFGLSALSQQQWDDGLFHTACGSPNYVAPEVMDDKGYEGTPADLWSCGIILYVLLVGCLPFSDSNLSNLYQKVHNPELEFPSNFPVEARWLIEKLLDPNPRTRLTVQGIYESMWFQAGNLFDNLDTCLINGQDLDEYDDFDMCFSNSHGNGEVVQNVPIQDSRPVWMNAFEIISMFSQGLDLSGLFIEKENTCKKETKFTSRHPPREILAKIGEFAWHLGYRVTRKNFKMKMKSSKRGRKGFLCVATEVMEVGPSLFMVNIHKMSGDTLEYRDFQQKLSIGLKDIVWKSEEDLTGSCHS
eukprot:c24649_g1_i1 orf=149-1618(-)